MHRFPFYHRLKSLSYNQHLTLALVLGLFFRLLCSFFVYGPQALDDYKHGLIPAYQFHYGLPLELPDYRSHLLHWTLQIFLYPADALGITSALGQSWCIYIGLSFIALLGIWGVAQLTRELTTESAAIRAGYLMSLMGLMPFISTRAFGEVIAMSLVPLAFYLIEKSKGTRSSLLCFNGFMILGLATLYRFQVGLFFLGAGVALLFLKNGRLVLAALIAGLGTLALQIGIDTISGKEFLGSLWAYLKVNEGGAQSYGVSPWFNTWIQILGFSLFPFSLVFYKEIPRLWQKTRFVLGPALLFIFIHSLIPHKEERFIYPAVGIVFMALAYVWSEAKNGKWVRRLYTPLFYFVSGLLLLVTTTNNSQGGEVEPMALLEQKYGDVLYLDRQSILQESRIREYFIRHNSAWVDKKEPLMFAQLESLQSQFPQLKAFAVLTSEEENRPELDGIEDRISSQLKCGKIIKAGSLADGIVYKLNPKKNRRRRPTWYVACVPTSSF